MQEKVTMMLLFRAFKTEEYALNFLNKGELYMNTLAYFKRYEEDQKNNIADEYEGIHKLLQPQDVVIMTAPMRIGEQEKLIETISAVAFYDWQHDPVKIYCLSILYIDKKQRRKKEIQIKELFDFEKNELGDYFVFIFDVPKFIKRMRESLDTYELGYGPVDYYDCSVSHRGLSAPIFMKSKKFAHQQEFRAVIKVDERNESFITNIGSLEDIAYPVLHKNIFKEAVLTNIVKKNDRYSMSLLYSEITS